MYKIDLSGLMSKEDFHKRIREVLPVPGYYGNNLDALNDVLGEINEKTEIVFSSVNPVTEEAEKLIKGLKRMADDINSDNEQVTIVFESETRREGNMEFRDLKKQYQVLKKDIDEAMIKVATDTNFISGAQVEELEKELAEFVGAKHCITCANGTDALSFAMMTWGIGEGDAVFVPDFTFFSSGEIVSHCKATPVFVDVDERTFNISLESLEKAIIKVNEKGELTPKAVVAVDLFGLPAELKEIKELCQKYNLLLLEDGAQGFGGHIGKGAIFKRACGFGDISTTSFFPAKPLGCYGDGGAIFTDNDEWADIMRSIRVHGKGASKYDNVRIGLNSRLDTLQAAILKVKLKAFSDYELADVNKAADYYFEAFENAFNVDENKIARTEMGEIRLPIVPSGYYSSWAQFTIILDNQVIRDALQSALKDKGIPSMIYYQKPMHKQEAIGFGDDYEFECPNTEDLCKRVLSLPIHPYLAKEDVEVIVQAIKDYLD